MKSVNVLCDHREGFLFFLKKCEGFVSDVGKDAAVFMNLILYHSQTTPDPPEAPRWMKLSGL